MPFLDLSLAELQAFRPDVAEPADFDAFWADTLEAADDLASAPSLREVETGLPLVTTYDLTFSGFDGQPVRAWIIVPREAALAQRRLPAIITFNGYGGGRGLPHEHVAWAAAGCVHVVMDTRGQGSGWGSGGSTADPSGGEASFPGFMTRGILDPSTYYYRRVFTDAVRAVATVRQLDAVDPARVFVSGGSQGGGMATAAAGLCGSSIAGALIDVPFLSHFKRAVGFTGSMPYGEISQYLSVHRGAAAQVFETLSYFDGVNFARRATAPALYSVALMDQTCPPSTVYASFNHYGGAAEIAVYEFNDHEGGGGHHWVRQNAWVAERASGTSSTSSTSSKEMQQ